MNDFNKNNYAKKRYSKLKTNKPHSKDISGVYSFNEKKYELKPLKLNVENKKATKQIHSIRFGYVQGKVFVNHKDYSVYNTTCTINYMNEIEFEYNNSIYRLNNIYESINTNQIEVRKLR